MHFFNLHTHFRQNPTKEILDIGTNQIVNSWFSVGIHPWKSENFSERLKTVITSAQNEYCLAIGEVGLDKLVGPTIEIQEKCFREMVQISEELNLPLIIHCVKAWNELRNLKRELRPRQKWIFHGFSKQTILREALNEGLFISVGAGIITHRKNEQIISQIPLDKLFIETDDAEMDIEQVYRFVADVKKISLQELDEIITHNIKNTFTKCQIG